MVTIWMQIVGRIQIFNVLSARTVGDLGQIYHVDHVRETLKLKDQLFQDREYCDC